MEVNQILVCEDEQLIAKRLVRFITTVATEPIEVASVFTLNQAFEYLSKHSINLLFLDLNLHGKDGFELLKKLSASSFHTIVVSAYTDRAIEAFEYGVLDFIGKPFTQERVKKAMERFEKDSISTSHYLKYIAVRTRKGIEFIEVDDIKYVKASGIYSELLLSNGTSKMYDKPMNQLLKLLPENFIRIHKSYVVPLEQISSIINSKLNAYEVLLKSGENIPLSRNKRKELIARLSTLPFGK